MDSAVRVPLSQRINFRLVVLLGVVLLLVGYPLYLFVDTLVSGGIWDARDDRGTYKKVDLRTISLFEMDQVGGTENDIPKDFRALDGKRVMLVGEMYTGMAAAGKQADFQLCYSIAKCCFTGKPKVQHFVKCSMTKGKEAEYYPGLAQVMGTLHVGIEREAGQVLSVYRMDVESVKPAR